MNIRQRITLLIALTFAALTFIGGFAVLQSTGSSREVKTVTEGVVPSALKSVELMAQLKDVQIATLAMVAATDKTMVEQTHAALAQKKAELQQALAQQMAQAENDTQKGLIRQAEESLLNYFGSIDDTANFMLQGQKELAEATMAATVDQYLREQVSVIETVQIEKRRSKDAAIASMNDKLTSTSTTLTVVTLASVLGLCAIGMLLYRQIILPIAEMERKMTEIATSQDFTHRVPVTRMDEIGRSLTAFNAMIEKIQESSEQVRQKTADIHAMLHYIPQGILTLEQGGRIHPEYSEHLKTVLETEAIAGGDVMQVVFADTGLGADTCAQISAAIGACIGEDEMNFGFNAHLLPSEVHKTLASGQTKVLDLNWSPITDESGTTLRLLLCLRDVTELRALAQAADAQKRELALIGEILAVRQEKFQQFIDSARQFIHQNSTLIDLHADGDAAAQQEAVAVLFRNLHTIKGNARTYGLRTLTNTVHLAEQGCDDVRSGTTSWNTALLRQDLHNTHVVLEDYARINAHTLGRQGPGRRGGVDKYVMADKEQMLALVKSLDAMDAQDPAAVLRTAQHARNILCQVGTERMDALLAGVLESLPSLAQELGKAAPVCQIDDHSVAVRTQLADTLRNVCMHLYRNAMDHGLEPATERLAQGKPAAGRITLSLQLDAEHLRLVLRDDGRGLALQHIHRKAIEQGLVDTAQPLALEQIAQLIFTPGFSTAQAVTEVSGRGVGMDAVKGFVEAEGGSIALVLLAPTAANGYCPFETVITLPAAYGVQI
jgi:two-component system chemotaxis sensor kinase CheA